MALLKIEDLTVAYHNKAVLKQVGLVVESGQVCALVGESGSGKSTLIKTIMQLLGTEGKVIGGKIYFNDKDCLNSNLQTMRGKELAMIFQNALQYLDSRRSISYQFVESILVHQKISKEAAYQQALDLLRKVGFDNPEQIIKAYPFELSGGMCQRVAIAMAIANQPQLLLADEPTSALDVTTQLQVVNLLLELKQQLNMTILIVTHNMAVAAYMADCIAVMKDGQIVEFGCKEQVIKHPQHQYTKLLLTSTPSLEVENA